MNEPFPPGSSTAPTTAPDARLLRVAAPRHPHRRRRDRRGRRALRRARDRRRRARPHELVGVALPQRAAPPHRARHELAELAANPQAQARVVHDLNADPQLPFADASFDAAVCCVSVDYLMRPVEVFRDVARVLRPGRAFRVHVLEPVLPDQGDPRLAVLVRRRSTARSSPSTSGGPAASTSRSSSAAPRPGHRRRPALRGLGPVGRLAAS